MTNAAQETISTALARAQKAMSHPKKTKTNPHYKSDYADLADVLNAVRPALNEQGIAVVQTIDGGELVTELRWHDEVISSRIPLNIDVKPQELGSQLSYLRRYALSAIAGVASEADDDGEVAQSAPPRRWSSDNVTTQDTGAVGNPQRGATVPDDWETRPLLSMTFTELRAVAEKVGHAFSGGTKAELIRTLQPVMDARTGQEPFELTAGQDLATLRGKRDDDSPEFNPVVAKPHTTATEREQRNQVAADIREGR